MEDLERLVISTLDAFKERLLAIARLSHRNALLSQVDPALALPSPAVGLMEVESQASLQLRATDLFRSVEPVGVDGEVVFAPVDRDFVAHPWKVKTASWLPYSDPGAGRRRQTSSLLAGGIRIELERPPGTTCTSDWLSLYVEAGPLVQWGLDQRHIYQGDAALEFRRPPLGTDLGESSPANPGVVHHHLEALSRNLVSVKLPAGLASEFGLCLDIRFEEGLPLHAQTPPPHVIANVCPVWNSLVHHYPEAWDVEQTISETRSHVLHRLLTRSLGPSWKAWSVTRVGAADDTRIQFHPSAEAGILPGVARFRPSVASRAAAQINAGDSAGLPPSSAAATPSEALSGSHVFYLSYVPSAETRGRRRGPGEPQLSVILSLEARELLDRNGRRLAVEFRATTGAKANGIPAGSEFQLIDTSGMPRRARVAGRLVGGSWGGSEGLPASLAESSADDCIRAFLPAGGRRSIGDVGRVIEVCYGNELELIDERDLLRPAGHGVAEPLVVRVRLLSSEMDPREKRVILESCSSFLERYLAGSRVGGIRLVEVEPGGESHECRA